MSAQFQIPLITVIPGQLITAALWNNEFNNIATNFIPAGMDSYSDTDAQMQIQTNPFPGSITSHASSLGGELERIRYVIAQITGNQYWYQAIPNVGSQIATNLQNLSVVMPVGAIIQYAGTSSPSGWLICGGQAVSRTTYSYLFAAIGTTYGAGDGLTTFNLPSTQGRFPIGTDGSPTYPIGGAGGTSNTTPAISISDPGHNHLQASHNHSTPDHLHLIDYNIQSSVTQGGLTIGNTISNNINGAFLAPGNSSGSGSYRLIKNITQGSGVGVSGNTIASNTANDTGITATSTNVPTIPPYIVFGFIIKY